MYRERWPEELMMAPEDRNVPAVAPGMLAPSELQSISIGSSTGLKQELIFVGGTSSQPH